MQAKPVFLLTTVAGLLFGVILMLVPELILDHAGITYLNGGPHMARQAASWILAVSLFAFLIRSMEHSDTRQAIFIMFDLAFFLMVVAELYAVLTSVASVMMWGIIALNALFVILYTYLFIENR